MNSFLSPPKDDFVPDCTLTVDDFPDYNRLTAYERGQMEKAYQQSVKDKERFVRWLLIG